MYKTMKELRSISNGDTRILYHIDYWDGPVSGVCLFNNKKCYFDTIDEYHENIFMEESKWNEWCNNCKLNNIDIDIDDKIIDFIWYRIYGIYETPDNVIDILDYNNKLFTDNVGDNCNYDINGKKIIYKPKDGNVLFNFKFKKVKIDKKWNLISKFIGPF